MNFSKHKLKNLLERIAVSASLGLVFGLISYAIVAAALLATNGIVLHEIVSGTHLLAFYSVLSTFLIFILLYHRHLPDTDILYFLK